jgi:hypothetical protein
MGISESAKQVRLRGATRQRPSKAEVTGEAPAGEFNVAVIVRDQQTLAAMEEDASLKPQQRSYLWREGASQHVRCGSGR